MLSGSVTEAIKGFYKLRKAFLTLDDIMAIESKYLRERIGSSRASLASQTERPLTGHYSRTSTDLGAGNVMGEKPDGDAQVQEILEKESETEPDIPLGTTKAQSRLLDIDPASVGITSHTDVYIHSGTRLCYGTLLVVFSMIENPLFSRILYIVGFKGDRERGTRYLWQSSRFNNLYVLPPSLNVVISS